MLEWGVINRDHVEMLHDTGYLYLKPDSSRAILGQNLIDAGFPRTPPGAQAHHWLPLAQKDSKLERQFLIRGIDPNLAVHGEFMDLEKHKLLHGKGTTGWINGDTIVHQWVKFFEAFPEAPVTQVIEFRDRIKNLAAVNVQSADLISWPYPK
jgi:hypothetical protein